MRTHFYPQQLLLCHIGLYLFEFEFEFEFFLSQPLTLSCVSLFLSLVPLWLFSDTHKPQGDSGRTHHFPRGSSLSLSLFLLWFGTGKPRGFRRTQNTADAKGK
jgi:hypothetical protein